MNQNNSKKYIMSNTKILFISLYIIILYQPALLHGYMAGDNVHFYRASYFWGEPRLERQNFSSFDALFGWGTSHSGRNSKGNKVPLLNVLGLHNMQQLGSQVPNLDPNNPLDQILIDLTNIEPRSTFGKLEFNGRFQIIELYLNAYHTIKNGFFVQANLPVRRLQLSKIHFKDKSPRDLIMPSQDTPAWQNFLSNFCQILQRWHFKNVFTKKINAGVGDISFMGGWTRNYVDTVYLDYVDVASKIGILFPTGKKRDEDIPFDISLGYNGHWGVPFKFDIAFGMLDWLTLGGHIGVLFLIGKNRKIRMRTSSQQNGYIKLARGNANVKPGSYFDFSLYTKADHFFSGLSILFGYAFNYKEPDCIEPLNKLIFNTHVVNADRQFKSFKQHIFQFMVEYDYAKKLSDIGPRVTFFYNYLFAGQRTFNTSMKGFDVGFDIAWDF